MHYFQLGTQYYIAGRYAALVWLIPVAGNLLHHAIEMYLKGCLAQDMKAEELKKLGHRLSQLWERFKPVQLGKSVDRFDPVVRALDRFEVIRYPDRILSEGMFGTISLVGPSPEMEPRGPQGPMPEYHLVVDDVDALVSMIFKHAQVNVSFLASMPRPGALEYLIKENRHLYI
jgi:hypothetical protein